VQNKFNALWQYFSSIKLALVLLTIITVASIIGTLIPQQDAAGEFLQGRSALTVAIFQFLQLGNLFRSVWFISLLGVFSLNLIVCSWNRFPAAWKLFRREFKPGRGDLFRDSPPEWRHQSKAPLTAEIKRVEALMKKKYRRVGSLESAEGTIIHGEKGAISYLGAYIIHAGILVIIMGALLGIFFGFKGFVNIMEGESVQVAQLISGKGVQPLGFTARCDKFTVEFYETGQPKLFRSDMTFTRGDQVLAKGALRVNHPMELEGIRFYQSSYGSVPEAVHLRIYKDNKEIGSARAPADGQVDLPEQGVMVKILRIEPNLMEMGPAVKVQAKIGGEVKELWIFQYLEEIKKSNPGILTMAPTLNPDMALPYRIVLEKLEERYYTGLQVNRDPGAPLVGIGALLMIYGLILAFFYPHRQYLVRLKGEKNGTAITLAGKTNKDTVILERELIKLMAAIKS